MRRGIAILFILSLAFLAKGQNVGVGIAAPNDLFHVFGTTATMGILFNNVTTGNTAANGLRITIDAGKNALFNQQEAASMQFNTSNTLRMTISAAGNVGINAVPAANEQLVVSNTNVNTAALVGSGNGGASGYPAGATGIGVMGVVGNGNPNVGVAGYHGAAVNVGAKGAGIFGASDIATGYGIYGLNSAANGTAGFFSASSGNAIIVPSGGGSVGIGTNAPDVSSILDMSGVSTKGILVPSVALTATNAAGPIASPATSLLVYNTATAGISPNDVTPGYYYNAGTPVAPNWVQLVVSSAAVSTGWLTTGNATTNTGTYAAQGPNFIGTTDNVDFPVRTSNTERMRVASTGIIGINSAPTAGHQLNVASSATSGQGNAAIYGSVSPSLLLGGAGIVGVANGSAYPATFNGNAGVVGVSGLASKNVGVAGYSGASASFNTPKVSGVYGESTFQSNPGVVGINTAAAGSGTTSNGGSGVWGSTKQSQSSGVFGTNNFGGPGVMGQSISGGAATFGAGVEGLSDGNGVYGVTQATGVSATNYAGVYGAYLPAPASALSGMAAVVGFNGNIGFPGTFNGNIGVEGLYNVGGPTTYYGIGVLGLGYGTPSGPPPPAINSDFGVMGVVAGARTTSAAVAGYFGVYAASAYPAPVNSAIYGNSSSAANWALYGTNSTAAAAGKGLFVNGTSNLIGVATLGTSSSINGSLVFNNSSNAFTATINSGVTTASYAWTLPATQGGMNTVLTNDGAGLLSWTTPSGGSVTSVTGNVPIYVATGTTTPVISIQGNGAGTDKGGVLYSTGAGTSASFNLTGNLGQILLSGNTAVPTWGNIAGIVTANNGLTATGTTTVNIQLGGALTQATTITHGNFDLIHNLTGTGNFRIQKAGTDAFDVFNSGQVTVNQSTAPNANLQMVTAGSTYSDNQVSTISLWGGSSSNYNMTNTSGTDLLNVAAGFEPSIYRADGQCQIKLVVFFYTNNGSDIKFQLHAHNASFDAYPIVCSSCGGAWTYSNVSSSGGNLYYVATSNWQDFTAYGANAFQIYLFGWVTNGGDFANIINAYVLVRPKNN